MALDIPENYEAYRMNCTDGTDTVGILCRRPDGGVSDLWRKMNRKAVSGVCPACGRDMKEHSTGTFSCNAGHILIVMTDSRATRTGATVTAKLPPRKTRIIPKRIKSAVLPPIKAQVEEVDVDVDEIMRTSMKEAGL